MKRQIAALAVVAATLLPAAPANATLPEDPVVDCSTQQELADFWHEAYVAKVHENEVLADYVYRVYPQRVAYWSERATFWHERANYWFDYAMKRERQWLRVKEQLRLLRLAQS